MSKDVEYMVWMCHYWAKRAFAKNENSVTGWMYLLMAESLRAEGTGDEMTGARKRRQTDKLTGGQNVQG